jgi:Zn-dependent protease
MQFLRELSIGLIVSRLAAVLVYAALHGFILAALARLFGDRRPQHEGRLTLNPFVHVSVWGAIMGALFALSWPRSIWFDPTQNRWSRGGIVAVVFGSIALMLALAMAVELLRPLALLLPRSGSYAVLYVLGQFQLIALGAALLNLLPIPGLVGGALLQAAWPDRERQIRTWEPIGIALVVAAIVAGWLPSFAGPLLDLIGR